MLDVFAERLKALIADEKLSRRKFTCLTGCQSKSLRYWLIGKYYPRHDSLIRIAETFGVSIDYLLGVVDSDVECDGFFPANYQEVLVNKLHDYMKREKLTYYKLAKYLEIGQTTIKRWFVNGSMPETVYLIKISQLLGERIDDLLGRGKLNG